MAVKTYSFTIKDPNQIRDDMLRTWRNGMISIGVPNPDATPGSDMYILFTALANELAVVEANAAILGDNLMPDTATGTDLDRIMAIFGLTRRVAAGSTGTIILNSSASTAVSQGAQLLDGSGLRYQVTAGGTYANAASIPIAAVDTGIATNLVVNSTLQWVAPPAYSAPTALVGIGGLVNGVNAEDDETARARLQAVLSNPPTAGNWQDVATLCENSTPAVQKAFVYPAVQGPATLHFAVTAAPTATNKNRDVNLTVLNNTVVPYVQGLMPEHVYVVGTTVANVAANVAFWLTLPSAPTASPPGPGGGWLDGTPWPTRVSPSYCDVTAVTSSTVFTINADNAPTAGVSRIAWLSPLTWTVYTAKVVSYTGTGPWTVTVDTPMTGIAVGNYIFPQSVNQVAYCNAILAQFALMGPGEKTLNATILTRGYRHPTPQSSWPSALNATMLRAISNVGPEVLNSAFGTMSTSTPGVPGAVTSAPNILVPGNLGLYPA